MLARQNGVSPFHRAHVAAAASFGAWRPFSPILAVCTRERNRITHPGQRCALDSLELRAGGESFQRVDSVAQPSQ